MPWLVPVAFAAPCIGIEEIDEVAATLSSGWLTTGARVREFEQAFADYVGRAARRRGEFVHRGAAPVAARGRRRTGRRGHHHAADVLRDRQHDHPRGRHAGVRRRRPPHGQHQPRAHRGGADPDARKRSFRCTSPVAPRTSLRIQLIAARHGLRRRRGRRARGRGAFERRESRRDRRLHLLQLLRDQESDHGRGRHGHDPVGRRTPSGSRGVAARHEPRCLDALLRHRVAPTTTS